MKKNRFLIIILTIVISFCFGIGRVEAALPPCNIGSDFDNQRGYGYARVTIDNNVRTGVDSGQLWICKNANCQGSTVITDGFGTWGTERSFYVEYDAGPNSKITEISYILYGEDKNGNAYELCKGAPEVNINKNNGVVSMYFSITQGHVLKISAYGKYINGDGKELDFPSDSFNIRKKLGNTESVKNTTQPIKSTKKGETTTTTTLPDADFGSNYGEHGNVYNNGLIEKDSPAGIKKASGTKTVSEGINGETSLACNTIGGVFDEYWPYVMIFVPILLIVMISIDFFKAMISGDADAIKKSSTNTIKRTIPAIILLALPALLRFIFEWFGIDFCI